MPRRQPFPPSTEEEPAVVFRRINIIGNIIEVVAGGILRAGKTDYGSGTGWWLGLDPADGEAKFDIGTPTDYFRYDQTNGLQIAADGSGLTSIDGGNIQTGTVTATQIAANTITAAQIAANTITAAEIAAVTITAAEIVANTITAAQIAADTITAAEIAADAITADEIKANTITAAKFNIALHYVDGTFTDDSPSAGYVAWAGCTVTYDGTTYPVDDGNTDKAIIWWDKSLSTSTFQTTDTYPTVDETDDIIVGWNTGGMFVPLWQTRSVYGENIIADTITANQIAAGTITAAELAANSVTAAKIDVTNLAAVAVNTGALTVDNTLTMGTGALITWASGDAKITPDFLDFILQGSDTQATRWIDGSSNVLGYLSAYSTADLTQVGIMARGPSANKYGKIALSVADSTEENNLADFSLNSDDGCHINVSSAKSGAIIKLSGNVLVSSKLLHGVQGSETWTAGVYAGNWVVAEGAELYTTPLVTINSGGSLVFSGTARVTVDTYITASGVKAPGAKPALFILHGLAGAWQFADAAGGNEEAVQGTHKLPTQMDKSVAPIFKVGWSANGVSPGNCHWQLAYRYMKPNDDTTATAQETLTTTGTASATSDGLIITAFSGMDLPAAADQAMFFEITRLSAHANDTIADTTELHGMLFTHTRNTLGTAT